MQNRTQLWEKFYKLPQPVKNAAFTLIDPNREIVTANDVLASILLLTSVQDLAWFILFYQQTETFQHLKDRHQFLFRELTLDEHLCYAIANEEMVGLEKIKQTIADPLLAHHFFAPKKRANHSAEMTKTSERKPL